MKLFILIAWEKMKVFLKMKNKYKMTNIMQLPEISRFDPQALAICLRPRQICKFERESATAIKYDYYRVCV